MLSNHQRGSVAFTWEQFHSNFHGQMALKVVKVKSHCAWYTISFLWSSLPNMEKIHPFSSLHSRHEESWTDGRIERMNPIHCKTSNIRCTKSPKPWKFFVSSCSCLCPIHWSQVLSQEWRCSRSSADRRCSNYIWVINNFFYLLCCVLYQRFDGIIKQVIKGLHGATYMFFCLDEGNSTDLAFGKSARTSFFFFWTLWPCTQSFLGSLRFWGIPVG